jgi:hypothetical protein
MMWRVGLSGLMVFAVSAVRADGIQLTVSASDSTWIVPSSGGPTIGHTDLYVTYRYDGPPVSGFISMDSLDAQELTGNSGFRFCGPLFYRLSDALFPIAPDSWAADTSTDGRLCTLLFDSSHVNAIPPDTLPVGEFTKPLIRMFYEFDAGTNATFTVDWYVRGYADPPAAEYLARATSEIHVLSVPEPPGCLLVLTAGMMLAALRPSLASGAPARRRARSR